VSRETYTLGMTHANRSDVFPGTRYLANLNSHLSLPLQQSHLRVGLSRRARNSVTSQ